MFKNRRDKPPLFSIAVVNFNHGAFIGSCLESIFVQDFDDYEVILVDGGSTDNSLSAIEPFRERLAFFVTEPDEGQSDAFSKAFASASGSYFVWVNADDILLQGALRCVSERLSRHCSLTESRRINWISGGTVYMSENGQFGRVSCAAPWNGLLAKTGIVHVNAPSSFFHRSLFQGVGGFDKDLHYVMDIDLWMKFARSNERFVCVTRPLWGLRIHSNSKTAHAFSREPEAGFLRERRLLEDRYAAKFDGVPLGAFRVWRFISGAYFFSALWSIVLKLGYRF
jgi:glycosyltransferase involved in cell wall biosynthesis